MTIFIALLTALVATAGLLPLARPIFAALFPALDQPVWQQASFLHLLLSHVALVGAAGGIAGAIGVAAGLFATSRPGREFRGLIETLAAIGQAFPPVAVLALTVPAIGFGFEPAIIALVLYGLLPIVQNTIAGLETVPAETVRAAIGMGMSPGQVLLRVRLPLAAPVLLAGLRVSLVIGTGTAAIASTVGAETLGLPIIVGLNGNNTAYVLQGALLTALLALTVDQGAELLVRAATRWRY